MLPNSRLILCAGQQWLAVACLLLTLQSVGRAQSATYYVDPFGSDLNDGSPLNPLATIGEAFNRVQAGDTILVGDGVYIESLVTERDGAAWAPITLSAQHPGQAVIQSAAQQALDIVNSHWNVRGLVFDGGYNDWDVVRVRTTADYLNFNDNEVRNGLKDGIDLGSNEVLFTPEFDFLQGVTIENSTFHHLLNNQGGVRADAHGIVAGAVRDMTIRNTNISYVSGDALQLQDGGWNNVLVQRSTFWNGPLPAPAGGFAAGVNPGENAIDTKQDAQIDVRGALVVQDSAFYGWRSDTSPNSPALNLKEKVSVQLEGNTLHDNFIGVQVRGLTDDNGAHVTVASNVLYDNTTAVRYEDSATNLHVLNNTFGAGHTRIFQPVPNQTGAGPDFQVLNNLFEAATKPPQAADPSNLAVTAGSFLDAAGHNYRLTMTSPALDAGLTLAEAPRDRDFVPRPQHGVADVGAFETSAVVAAVSPNLSSATSFGPGGYGVAFAGPAQGLFAPVGAAYDAAGNLFVSDALQNVLLRLDRAGHSAVVAGLAQGMQGPTGLAVAADGSVYVANYLGDTIVKVDSTGNTTVVADAADGMQNPFDVAVDSLGNLFVADLEGRQILKIDPSGSASVFADVTDGLFSPLSVAIDAMGQVYVADVLLNQIVRFDSAGNDRTILAGSAQGIVSPTGIALDDAGNLLVANYLTSTLVKLAPNGTATPFSDAAAGVHNPFDVAYFNPFAAHATHLGPIQVPEPTGALLAAIALAALGLFTQRRRAR